ncbi:DUF6402 family protein, partial [Herbaspirillum sp. RTI4]|uniref:DUF6402 family protein n=1 Tax=Herbaspirillum sp. RTI4 TaxID=3048640 RepID=UPI002B22C90A
MAKVKKIPYYQMGASGIPFTSPKWKCHMGSEGCVPINTLQTVSYDRLAPGEKPPPQPNPPKLTPERLKTQQAEEANQRALAAQAKKKPRKESIKTPPQPQPKELDAEDHAKIPAFDLQDIPAAMEAMGWPVSAKLARKWFAGSKNIWDDDLNSVQPIDDSTITLDWALNFGCVKDKYKELFSTSIYNDKSISILKTKLKPIFNKNFNNSIDLNFSTTAYVNNLREFHRDWHFQYSAISDSDTTNGIMTFTDLTGSLANFNIYIAIG